MPWQKLDRGDTPSGAMARAGSTSTTSTRARSITLITAFAQTVSLEIWALLQEDRNKAWDYYMAYTVQGGSDTFVNMLKKAGLKTPFDEACLREVCETAGKWLEGYDLSGIE